MFPGRPFLRKDSVTQKRIKTNPPDPKPKFSDKSINTISKEVQSQCGRRTLEICGEDSLNVLGVESMENARSEWHELAQMATTKVESRRLQALTTL